MGDPDRSDDQGRSVLKTARAYLVHLYTASGVVFALLAAGEIAAGETDVQWTFYWLFCAVLVDATDGMLARQWKVQVHVPHVDGAAIDDIVDYLTYTFLPLLLVWKMGWLPSPAGLWIVPALVTSLFGFANTRAKQAGEGFFLGFPSYWNIVAFYVGIWVVHYPGSIAAVAVLLLSLLTVMPVRFLYLTRMSGTWQGVLIVGAVLWGITLLYMLVDYPDISRELMLASLIYPAVYVAASAHIDLRHRGRL